MTNRRKTKTYSGHAVPPSTKIPDVVQHPKYGDTVVTTPWATTREVILASYWGYHRETFFPESAIPANIQKQSPITMPRRYYVDILKQCRDCGLSFLFFAREQQYWYEELGFYIDSDCVRCPVCRKSEQHLRQAFGRYSELVGRTDLSDSELSTLVEDTTTIYEADLLRDEQRLRTIKNLAVKRIPNSKATRSLCQVVERLSHNS